MNINDFRGNRRQAPHGTVGFSDGRGFYTEDNGYHPLEAACADRMRGQIWVHCRVRGNLTWIALDSLSPALWRHHREKITTALKEEKLRYFQYMEDNRILENTSAELDATEKMLFQLYKKLKDEDKKEFLKNNPKSRLAIATCLKCLSSCEEKLGCIHAMCPGLCNNCHCENRVETEKNSEHKCFACDQKQIIQCPICQEDKISLDMVKAKGGCDHSVCWKCFGQAYITGHPINSCPLCRGAFIDADELYGAREV